MSSRQVAAMTAVALSATGAKAAEVKPRKPKPPCSSGWVGTNFKLRLDNLNATKVQSSHLQSARPSKNWKMDVLTTTAYQPAAVKWRSAPDPRANHGAASTRPLYEVAV